MSLPGLALAPIFLVSLSLGAMGGLLSVISAFSDTNCLFSDVLIPGSE